MFVGRRRNGRRPPLQGFSKSWSNHTIHSTQQSCTYQQLHTPPWPYLVAPRANSTHVSPWCPRTAIGMPHRISQLLCPSHHATSLPKAYLSLPGQAIDFVVSRSASVARALLTSNSSNTWRA
jgi:hypothetical protein